MTHPLLFFTLSLSSLSPSGRGGIPRRPFSGPVFRERDRMNSTSLTRKETEQKAAASAPAGPQ